MEPEQTQHNLARLQTRKHKSATLLFRAMAKRNIIQLACVESPNKIRLFPADSLARHLLQLAYDTTVGAMDKT